MSEVRAFVGHSFSDDDKEVVTNILGLLDRVRAINHSFSWENAQWAEPREISAKVLQRFEDKNLFIGICTRHERAIKNGSLTAIPFTPFTISRRESYSWKASDWVLQEVAIATSRSMPVILLKEADITNLSGIQGNIEYIEFDRDRLEACYPKILEMIAKVVPAVAALVPASPKQTTAIAPGDPPASEQPRQFEPQADWTTKVYENTAFMTMMLDRVDDFEKVYSSYLATEEGRKPEHAAQWEALTQYIKIVNGKIGSAAALEQLAREWPKNHRIIGFLAQAYEYFEDFGRASLYFTSAAALSEGARHVIFLANAAKCALKQDDKSDVSNIEDQLRKIAAQDGELRLPALRALAEVFDQLGHKQAWLAINERYLELDSTNTELRFQIAYKYAEADNNNLTLFHYRKIPREQRHDTTWNNLGVAYGSLQLRGMSVDAFREAEKRGSTLAMSNIANNFITAGFLREARSTVESAQQAEERNPNVATVAARLEGVSEEEETRLKELMDSAKRISIFYRRFGNAMMKELSAIDGLWQGPVHSLSLSCSGSQFTALGSYETENAMRGLLFAPAKTKMLVTYTGIVRGSSIEASYSTKREGSDTPSLGLSILGRSTVLMIVSDDRKLIHVLENPYSAKPEFYDLVKVNPMLEIAN